MCALHAARCAAHDAECWLTRLVSTLAIAVANGKPSTGAWS